MGSCDLVLLAAGLSRRFGGNKLLSLWRGEPMYLQALNTLEELSRRHPNWHPLVVTQYPEIQETCASRGIDCYHNQRAAEGISTSIRLAVSHLTGEAAAFFVADQPQLRPDTAEGLLTGFFESGKGLASVTYGGELGNPCAFSRRYFSELAALEGDRGGKGILRRHLDDVFRYPVSDPMELEDIDTPQI